MTLFGIQLSKKLLTLLFAVLLLILDGSGVITLGEQNVDAIKWVVVAYIGGQSVVDSYLKPTQESTKGADE